MTTTERVCCGVAGALVAAVLFLGSVIVNFPIGGSY